MTKFALALAVVLAAPAVVLGAPRSSASSSGASSPVAARFEKAQKALAECSTDTECETAYKELSRAKRIYNARRRALGQPTL